jgi:hypothetical protein
MEEETYESQVGKLAESIQQIQARVLELELQEVPSTSVGSAGLERRNCQWRNRKNQVLALECKKISDQSVQTYENLAEDLEVEDIGGTSLGGETTSIDSARVAETTFGGRKYEKVIGGAHSSTTGQCHSK